MPHVRDAPDEFKPGRIFRISGRSKPTAYDFGPLPVPPLALEPVSFTPTRDVIGDALRLRERQAAADKAAAEAAAQQAQQRVTELENARRRRRQRDEEALIWLLAA